MERPLNSPNRLSSIPTIASALEALDDADQHQKRIAADESGRSDAEGPSYGRFHAETGHKIARDALLEIVISEALDQKVSYDEAMDFLRRNEFDCDERTLAEFDELLSQFTPGADIFVKDSSFYLEPFRGTIVGEASLFPYNNPQSQFVGPMIHIEIDSEGVVDGELIPIHRNEETGLPVTPSVVVGTEAIDALVAMRKS